MVRIRLRRVGAKKQPSYRVVVADQRKARDGRFIETIGHYDPRTEPPTIVIDGERAQYWLAQGAQPSEAVARMLKSLGISATSAGVSAEAPAEEQPQTEAVEAAEEQAQPADAE
ncbi:MAG: 30S ribosomal protein S16 [Anaerolineae bacterium]|nr:30S ribosomal protein S16 [Anaerolineae bacterium]